MKRMSSIKASTHNKTAAITLGIAALLALAAGITPNAKADEWRNDHRETSRVDYREIHRDEDRISRLQDKLDEQERHHNWRGARDTRHELDKMRDKLARDRRELHRDRW